MFDGDTSKCISKLFIRRIHARKLIVTAADGTHGGVTDMGVIIIIIVKRFE